MKSTLLHRYPQEYYDLYKLAENGFTFRQWKNEVERLASKIMDVDNHNKFKGDMLEVFAELFFTLLQNDASVGIKDYSPIDIHDDYGVDATGINVNGHNCVVQVKYRGNPTHLVEYEAIAKTYTSSILQLHIEDVYLHDHTVYLFTNANGVTQAFEKVMHKKAVLVTNGIICAKVDNNVNFWKSAYNMIFSALDA